MRKNPRVIITSPRLIWKVPAFKKLKEAITVGMSLTFEFKISLLLVNVEVALKSLLLRNK